jgi:hypothetical protein
LWHLCPGVNDALKILLGNHAVMTIAMMARRLDGLAWVLLIQEQDPPAQGF